MNVDDTLVDKFIPESMYVFSKSLNYSTEIMTSYIHILKGFALYYGIYSKAYVFEYDINDDKEQLEIVSEMIKLNAHKIPFDVIICKQDDLALRVLPSFLYETPCTIKMDNDVIHYWRITMPVVVHHDVTNDEFFKSIEMNHKDMNNFYKSVYS